ncbi:MAG: hypothetical protein E7248_22635, partial [Paenibacillaceae bacterium]|nr:hypothetical protein [Paenibacillaceae bacterium]
MLQLQRKALLPVRNWQLRHRHFGMKWGDLNLAENITNVRIQMKKFKNYSISKKLITAFLTVTFIMLLVGAMGLLGMARIDAMDTYMYQVKTAPMNDLILAIENLYQIKSDSRDMVIQTGDS